MSRKPIPSATDAQCKPLTDTGFSNGLAFYRDVLVYLGFEEVLTVDRATNGHLFIFAHRDGLLLKFDTHHMFDVEHVNGASVYYNWKPNDEKEGWHYVSSGHGSAPGIWIGDHDAREKLIAKLDGLRKNGSFITPWFERPFLWLLHYDDPKAPGYDYRAINRERIARLPDWVREFVGPEVVQTTAP